MVDETEVKQSFEGVKIEPPKEEVADNIVDDANVAAERLEKANLEYKSLIERAEKLHVEKTLSGEADAGNTAPPLTEEERKIANVKEFLAGTGMEEDF